MRGIYFDPRTKLIALLFCILSTMVAPSLKYELILVGMIACFCLIMGKAGYAVTGTLAYAAVYGLTWLSLYKMTGSCQAVFTAFCGLINKVYPCGFLAGAMIMTTKTGEFMAALYQIHMPEKVVIPLAVMMRYIPVVKEDWQHIKDAMKMRDLAPTPKNIITHPMMTAQCLYVPMMMAASKTADELSMAAVTRGIENPGPKTCLTEIKYKSRDLAVICILTVYLIWGLMMRGGVR